MADANVQQSLVTDFGAGENTTTASVSSVSTTNAFARISNFKNCAAGPTAGIDGSRGLDDLGCTCLLSDATTVTLVRAAGGLDEDVSVAIEVIEFPGSGGNAAIVRMHQDITLNAAVATLDTPVSGVSTIGDCVPIICGVREASTGQQASRMSISAQLVDASGANIRLTRGSSTNACIVSVAVVEFTGANWSVQQNISHTQTTIDTVETESCSAVTWSETMIFSSLETTSDAAEGFLCGVWPGATTTTVKFQCGSTSATTYAHLVSNSNLVVESINSLDGSESAVNADGTDPMLVDKTVSSSTLADHMVIVTGASASTNNQTNRWTWNYYLTSTTNLRFWTSSSGGGSDPDWAAQLIDVSALTDGGTNTTIEVPTGPIR